MKRTVASALFAALFLAAGCTAEPTTLTPKKQPLPEEEVLNTPPSLTGVAFSPAGPYRVTSALTATAEGWKDAEGAKEKVLFQWVVNGTPVAGQTSVSLSAPHFQKGDSVSVTATPNDGTVDGLTVESDSVLIENSAPQIGGIAIVSGTYYTDTPVTALVSGAADADDDTLVVSYRWYVDGVVQAETSDTLDSANFTRGQSVYAEARVFDGELYTGYVASTTASIQNRVPTMSTVVISPGTAYETSTLAFTATSADGDSADTVTYDRMWLKAGAETGITAATLTGAAFNKGDVITLRLTPYDGTDYGAPLTSAAVTILNTAPTQADISLSPATYTTGDDLFVAIATASTDVDPADTVSYSYQWFKNSAPQALTAGTTVIPAASLFGNEVWTVVVTPSDGFADAATSYAQITIPGVIALAAGPTADRTCAIIAGGSVKCWGDNSGGGVGDNTAVARPAPTNVTGTSGATAIAVGESHTCAVVAGGAVKCWGYNDYGQLGDGTVDSRYFAVAVTALTSGAIAVAAGRYHSCALTNVGGVKCWGSNEYGQLGIGSTTNKHFAVDVNGLASGVIAISAGESHTCALTTAGGVKCWGFNHVGQLGDDTVDTRETAVDVTVLASEVIAITAGNHFTCALTTTGGVKCWGENVNGQLGDGTNTSRQTALDVVGLSAGVKAIATGSQQSCALLNAGTMKCWGNNYDGQLGDGTYGVNRWTPVDVTGLTGEITAITVGANHACALSNGRTLYCFGNNVYGQIGDGTVGYNILTATDVSTLTSGAASVATGYRHSCALTGAGGVKCWGQNTQGQLGDNSNSNRWQAVSVSGMASEVSAIAVGYNHSCALTTAGGVKCWGSNSQGQLGDNSSTSATTPVEVAGLASGVTSITAGQYHSCALTHTGGVKCWGNNLYNQLGNSGGADRWYPVDVTDLTSGVKAIEAGADHTCALTSGGGVMCWGQYANGRLGDDLSSSGTKPGPVLGLDSGVTAISAGFSHSCAIQGGTAKCWGINARGELGDNTTTQRNSPVDLLALTGIASISAGYRTTCAVLDTGSLQCWGLNDMGQLGDGTTANRNTPGPITGLSTDIVAVSQGGHHVCARNTGGGLKCWGYNEYGQIGDNYNHHTPKAVVGLLP